MFSLFPKYEDYVKSIDFSGQSISENVYYMKQTISNACGTVAMIHSVANNLDVIDLGNGILKDFLEATKDSSPEEKAKQLEDNNQVCEVHDNIAREGQTAVSNSVEITGFYSHDFYRPGQINWEFHSVDI